MNPFTSLNGVLASGPGRSAALTEYFYLTCTSCALQKGAPSYTTGDFLILFNRCFGILLHTFFSSFFWFRAWLKLFDLSGLALGPVILFWPLCDGCVQLISSDCCRRTAVLEKKHWAEKCFKKIIINFGFIHIYIYTHIHSLCDNEFATSLSLRLLKPRLTG